MPLENTLQGSVIETVDALLSVLNDTKCANGCAAPRRPAVADTALQISHQLVGLKGASLADITYVRSHEQALGQSAAWLDAHLPNAKREPVSSTAAAVATLLESGDKHGAAICSKAAYENDKDRLELLADGTQGDPSAFSETMNTDEQTTSHASCSWLTKALRLSPDRTPLSASTLSRSPGRFRSLRVSWSWLTQDQHLKVGDPRATHRGGHGPSGRLWRSRETLRRPSMQSGSERSRRTLRHTSRPIEGRGSHIK